MMILFGRRSGRRPSEGGRSRLERGGLRGFEKSGGGGGCGRDGRSGWRAHFYGAAGPALNQVEDKI